MAIPLVSIVIPTFNMGSLVADSIRSALNQTYQNIEVILIDDGSSDDTRSILTPHIEKGAIRYHYQELRSFSGAKCRIALSKGDFIALLDADDLWETSKISSQVAMISEDPVAGMVFTDFDTFDESGTIAARKNSVVIDEIPEPDLVTMLKRSNFIYPSTVLLRRSVFDLCGFFDVSLRSVEDYDMWLRIAEKYRLISINNPLVKIRQHSANMSKNIPRMLENEIEVINKFRTRLTSTAYRKRIAKCYLLSADRSLHNGDRLRTIRYLIKGILNSPAVPVDVLVVLIKLILGGKKVEELRRSFNNQDSVLAEFYKWIYRRY